MFALVFQNCSGLEVGLYFSSAMVAGAVRQVQLECITGTAVLRGALAAAHADNQSANRTILEEGAPRARLPSCSKPTTLYRATPPITSDQVIR